MARSTMPLRPRLPENLAPGLDRSRTVTITFAGQPIEAYMGDTVASAAYAAGVRIFSRSFKYHRPRGLLCCSGRCPNCLVTVDGTPNVRACTTPVAEGMRVEAQNVFPSLQRDALAIVDRVDRLLPVGFYYKTFIYPCGAWPFYETVLRHIAGLGRLDFDKADHGHHAHRHLHPDVAVIGGGPAGLAAALAAAEQGARVVIVDDNPALGGQLYGDGRVYDELAASAGPGAGLQGRTGHAIAQELGRHLAVLPNVELLLNATAFGLYEGNLVAVAQGETLIELRAGQIVIATGAFEHPLVFQNNDLPGVMLGSAATRLIRHWGVAPGRRAVVVSAHDEGLRVALELLEAGIEVAAVAEHRTQVPDGPELRALRAKGVRMFAGWSIAEASGAGAVERATLVKLDGTGRPIAGSERRGRCDLIALSTGLETNASLLWQAGCTVEYDPDLDLFTPRSLAPGIQTAGDVTGVRDLRAALLGGHCAGLAAALSLRASSNGHAGALTVARAELETLERRFRERVRARPIAAIEGEGRKKFVCPCEDVTVKDIDWAVAEGFDHIETLKRYSTVTMGPCQGKMCAMNAVQACARATGRSIGETGTTTSRPLVQPVSLGTLAGPHLEPARLTPMHQRHLELGAVMMDAGQWKRPRHYTSPENECRAVRERVGIIDVSTLGKIDLQGRDAVRLLERIYTNRWADLKVGRVRYGLMADEAGIIMDDGTVARLAEDRFLITTTSSGVAAVEEWLTWWMEGTGWCAHLANVTSGLAAVNLAGPRSREVLAKLTDTDVSAAALPYLAAAQATVAGIPAIILRIGFVGELGYELHVPAQYGEYFWDALMEAGKEYGITPFGLEAQRILRLEKGHIIVTQDTDALSTPPEAGMAWMVKLDKDDFIGKTSLANLKQAGMGQKLVGFEMEDARQVPEEGCQIVREDGYPIGRVTSARFSPTLGKALGLAWVPASLGSEGTTLSIRRDGQSLAARVVRVPFYDPAGTRMRS